MAVRDNRINATMGGVSRTVGNDAQDLVAIERRRKEAERLGRPVPKQAFMELLDETRERRGREEEEAAAEGRRRRGEGREGQAEEEAVAAAPVAEGGGVARRGGFVPRGRGRLVRG